MRGVVSIAGETTKELSEVSPGTQAILEVPAMKNTLEILPSEAFDGMVMVWTNPNSGVLGFVETTMMLEDTVRQKGGEPSDILVVPVTGTSIGYDGPLRVSERVAPNDLNKLYRKVGQALNELGEDAWMYFDNLNFFLVYSEEERVQEFTKATTRRARDRGARGVYCVVRDDIDRTVYRGLKNICDTQVSFD